MHDAGHFSRRWCLAAPADGAGPAREVNERQPLNRLSRGLWRPPLSCAAPSSGSNRPGTGGTPAPAPVNGPVRDPARDPVPPPASGALPPSNRVGSRVSRRVSRPVSPPVADRVAPPTPGLHTGYGATDCSPSPFVHDFRSSLTGCPQPIHTDAPATAQKIAETQETRSQITRMAPMTTPMRILPTGPSNHFDFTRLLGRQVARHVPTAGPSGPDGPGARRTHRSESAC